MDLEEYRKIVKETLSQMVDKAGLLGLSNIIKSIKINMDLSEGDHEILDQLHLELMQAERIAEMEKDG